jgi:bifunctional UDP-N-acetylglucosamine pyrophosphorylase / glucosamine-1-phosphate N-acetyltransferase
VRSPTLATLVRHHRGSGAAATLLTARLEEPLGYDRVVRGKDDGVQRVAEASEVAGDDRFIDEVATPIHVFRHSVLAPALRRLRPTGRVGEHLLSDVYAVLHDAGYRVESLLVADPMEAAGVNDRAQLAIAEAELRYRINERWMRRGVTMWDPEQTYVDASVHLGRDVVLLPGVTLRGDCTLGAGAEVGPHSHLVDTFVGEGAKVANTSAVRADIGEHARVGPFAVLGPGAMVPPGAVVEPFSHVVADTED